ncbi:MAG: DUF3089 domain-containing protein [Bacteroidales bacterium]|jgi:hypothetical protein|nr:DUF3089 domain-containing protein [Bacteroidales bacterium]
MKQKTFILILNIAACALFFSCSERNSYSDRANWQSVADGSKAVDVFFIYPTVIDTNVPYVSINDTVMRYEADKLISRHRGIFDEVANFYAPYYRQLSIPYIASLSDLTRIDSAIDAVAASDCYAAFEYYLEHYNNGRPFIIAAHSQGSIISRRMILQIRKHHSEVFDRMIAAYLIGFTITPEWLHEAGLEFASNATDLGKVITWNLENAGAVAVNPLIFAPDALVINPVNWKTDTTYAAASESLGSKFFGDEFLPGDHIGYADAKINAERRSVQTTTPIPPASDIWPAGILHHYDYEIYYYDFKKNVEDRVSAYLSRDYGSNPK